MRASFLSGTSHVFPFALQPSHACPSPEGTRNAAGFGPGFPVRRHVEVRVDVLMNQLARELADAIAAAISDNTKVEACREKARAAGFDMRVSLDAAVGFAA